MTISQSLVPNLQFWRTNKKTARRRFLLLFVIDKLADGLLHRLHYKGGDIFNLHGFASFPIGIQHHGGTEGAANG